MDLHTISYDDKSERWIARHWKARTLLAEIPLSERDSFCDGNALDEAAILFSVRPEDVINEAEGS